MNCEEARLGLLIGDPAAESHLANCATCRADSGSWRRWRSLLAEPSTWEEPGPHLEGRILAATRGVAESPLAGPPPAGRRPWWDLIVAAVALVVLVTSYGVATALTPDWQFSLEGELPGASAQVEGWNAGPGTRMRFRIDGIDPAPEGHYYEIWMTAEDGRHISAGTFRDQGTVTVWAAVKRSEFPRIWITLEAMDGDLGPSPNAYFDTVG